MYKVLVIASFFLNHSGNWNFIFRLFQGDYEEEVLENVRKYWNKNYPSHCLTINKIKHFDELGSAHITEINK